VRVVEFMKMPVEAIRVLIKAVRVPLVPKEAARVYNTLTASTTLSRPQQHSHGPNNTLIAEKVLVNFLLQAN
jgi:hypothetical protein